MASSHDGICPRNLLEGQVTGTSPLVFGDLYLSVVLGVLTRADGREYYYSASLGVNLPS